MKFYFKVVWECGNGETMYNYYKSTSISALLSYLGDMGASVGFIIEVKRVSRLPKNALAYNGYYGDQICERLKVFSVDTAPPRPK